jgi:hypothetical protein
MQSSDALRERVKTVLSRLALFDDITNDEADAVIAVVLEWEERDRAATERSLRRRADTAERESAMLRGVILAAIDALGDEVVPEAYKSKRYRDWASGWNDLRRTVLRVLAATVRSDT